MEELTEEDGPWAAGWLFRSGTLEAGDLVAPDPTSTTVLRSGGSVYADAVVISINPPALASRDGDMLWWTTVSDMRLIRVGRASPEEHEKAATRLSGV